jgi:hypothetical protein
MKNILTYNKMSFNQTIPLINVIEKLIQSKHIDLNKMIMDLTS